MAGLAQVGAIAQGNHKVVDESLDFAPLGLGEFGRGLRDIGDNDAGKAQPVGGFALFATATVGQNGISSKSGSAMAPPRTALASPPMPCSHAVAIPPQSRRRALRAARP
jgi:hypothetical protein